MDVENSGDNDVKPGLFWIFIIAAFLQILWGVVPSASRLVIEEIPVELYIAIRWTISGAIFAMYVTVVKAWTPISWKTFAAVFSLGVLGYGGASVGMLYGLRMGGVANFAMMSALGPVVTAMLAVWLLRERPRPIFYIALPLSVIGLMFLVFGKFQVTSLQIAGTSALLILLGFSLEALVFVFSKRFRQQMPISQYLAISQLSAAGFFWFLQGSVFQQTDQITQLSGTGIAATIFVSVVACVFCYSVLYWLLTQIDGHKLALFDSFHTLSATTFGVLFFNEILSPWMFLGGAMILIGLVTGNWPQRLTEDLPE